MDALAGPYLASAVLLVAAGATKLGDPVPLLRALHSVGLRVPRGVVRLLAAAEVLLGLAAILAGGRAAAIGVALSYAAFSGFVLLSMRRGGVLSSCGCFGKDDTPPTGAHVAVTASAAAVAALVAVSPVADLVTLLESAGGAALLMTTAAVAALAYLVLARLPLLTAARRVAR